MPDLAVSWLRTSMRYKLIVVCPKDWIRGNDKCIEVRSVGNSCRKNGLRP